LQVYIKYRVIASGSSEVLVNFELFHAGGQFSREIFIFHNEAQIVFETLIQRYAIQSIFSSEEIGNGLTYERDKAMKNLFLLLLMCAFGLSPA
jgi:hypothetical protein